MNETKAKEIREVSQIYFNKKKQMRQLYRDGHTEAGKVLEEEVRQLALAVKAEISVGDEIKVKRAGWVTIKSIQKGRISPLGLCCSNGHLYECEAILEIK